MFGTLESRDGRGRLARRQPAKSNTRPWSASSRIAAVAIVLAAALMSTPTRAATPLDLSGEWVNRASIGSEFHLEASAARRQLTATWNGAPGPHARLVGSFTGTLNQDGTAYTGPMHVSEAGNSAGGTMTITITSQVPRFSYGRPQLNVTYQQDNGVGGSFTLELVILPLKTTFGPEPAVDLGIGCPSTRPCSGGVEFGLTGSAIKVVGPGSGWRQTNAGAARKKVRLGSVRFSIKPQHSARIRLRLNGTGRKLLAKRGSLRLPVILKMNPSSGLRPRTNLGTVTFRKR